MHTHQQGNTIATRRGKNRRRKLAKDRKPHKKNSTQANEPQGRQRSPEARAYESKGRRKRRATCNDTQSSKTKRRIDRKNAGERERKLLKGRQGRKTKKENGEPNIHDRTPTDVEEKSEQPTSEYGVWNCRQSSLTGEKEDTEAKSTRREHYGETQTGRAACNDRKSGKQKDEETEIPPETETRRPKRKQC